MRLGKEQATGFVSDEEQGAVTGEAGRAPGQAPGQEPAAPPVSAPQQEPAGTR